MADDRVKKVTGRPTVMTQAVLDKLEQAFSIGCKDIEACLHAGICKSTLKNYQRDNPDFLARKEMLKEKQVLKARFVVANAINKKDEATAKWYLERKAKNEFSTQVNKQNLGADGQPIDGNKVFVTQSDARKQADLLDSDLE